ncbi:MAG: fenitrothion hydrolase [Actinobacteria bacterium]|nr:fenitrothion hydrolase [Actinomycetota bacterium]
MRSAVRKPAAGLAVLAACALLTPAAAGAHGIAQRADLPIPTWLFAWGASLVLLASFAALAVLWPRPRLQAVRERVLVRLPLALELFAGALGVVSFALVVYAGLAGNQTATANLAPTAIFVVLWVGFPVASALFGDVFAALSPWRAVGRGVGFIATRLGAGALPAPMAYPARLGRWPAVLGILAFVSLELIDVHRDDPSRLAVIALLYAAVMLVGMSLYGAEAWCRNGDAFGVTFATFARLSPLHGERRELRLRPPLAGAPGLPQVPGATALILVLIGTTSFDGFSQGDVWTGEDGLAERLTRTFGDIGFGREAAIQLASTAGLLAMVLLVAGLYRLGVAGMRSVGRDHTSAELARRFGHTLIPIALAYLVAHYFSLLIFQGQALGYLASDPLGHGADLFGTADWTIDYGVVSANAIWYVQVGALVVGHVCGLILAHDRALATWSSPRTAMRSQYWMLSVMVAFTCLGLWLLSASAQ